MLKDTKIIHKIKNQIYILISKGQIKINDKILNKGDGAEIINLSEINRACKISCVFL